MTSVLKHFLFLITFALVLSTVSSYATSNNAPIHGNPINVSHPSQQVETSYSYYMTHQITMNYTRVSPFDFVFHENKFIEYPHATFPSLLSLNQLLRIDFSKPLSSPLVIGLGVRDTNTVYLWNITALDRSTIDLNVTGIPAGMYDLLLFQEQSGNLTLIDSQAHSVRIYENISKPKFIHVSDTHLPLFTKDKTTLTSVREVFKNISQLNPDFVLITGDFLEGTATYMINETTQQPPLYSFSELVEIGLRFLDEWDFPIIVTAGNHDWMKIYPSRDYSVEEWFKFMYPHPVQHFRFGNMNLIGYSILDEITDNILANLQASVIRDQNITNIFYTHFDFDGKLASNIQVLSGDVVIHGHEHHSGIYYKNGALWVKTHNVFEPQKMSPSTGFRVIQYVNTTHVNIDENIYPYHGSDDSMAATSSSTNDNNGLIETQTAPPNNQSLPALSPNILFIMVSIIMLRKRPRSVSKNNKL